MPVATCRFKPDSKTYDYLYDEADMSLAEGDLVIVESDFSPYGLTIVKIESIADNEPKWATKRIHSKVEGAPF